MSIMNQKDVKNNVHRSGFDLSRRVCFTAKVGELLPINWIPVLPGDKIEGDLRAFGRTAPLQTATFGRIREYYDVFFVPYRLLWRDFPEWIIQTKQSRIPRSLTTKTVLSDEGPYILDSSINTYLKNLKLGYATAGNRLDDGGQDTYDTSRKLLSYLGYHFDYDTSGVKLNFFPLLTYQKIYQDYFRFSQWEDYAPYTCNVDYLTSSGSFLDISSITPPTTPLPTSKFLPKNMFWMQYCNFDRDMFNGILPNAQYGEESLVDVLGPSSLNGSFALIAENLYFSPFIGQTSNGVETLYFDKANGKSVVQGNVSYPRFQDVSVDSGESNRLNFYLSKELTANFSILSLRKAEARQKWKEITQSGDLDYVSQISKHWNESAPDALSGKCQYIAGTSRNVDVSEVINQNLTSENAVADIAGKGVTVNNGHFKFDNKSNDYGILMVMYHAKPLIEWEADTVFNKELLKTTVDQYAIPEFDNLGNEKVFGYELAFDKFTTVNQFYLAGYAPRYYEYKTSFDIALGEFQKTLKPWIIPFKQKPRMQGSPAKQSFLNYTYFKVQPSIVDNLFGVAADGSTATDHFYNTCYMDIKAVRNLSRDGLPY